mmetsp:Transcript_111950/g.239146  ORF Transcript_111950/g.239146 Transcript_111950/m.239146 type:complete len:217 (-) Transcript_111950:831-1481(-)
MLWTWVSDSLNCFATFFSCFSTFSAACIWRSIALFAICSVSTSPSISLHFSACQLTPSDLRTSKTVLSMGKSRPSFFSHSGRIASSRVVDSSSSRSKSATIFWRSSSSCSAALIPPCDATFSLGAGANAKAGAVALRLNRLVPSSGTTAASASAPALLSRFLLRLSAFASASASAAESAITAFFGLAGPLPRALRWLRKSARAVKPCLCAESRSFW